MDTMIADLSTILFDECQIRTRIKELGFELSKEYAGKNPVLICILKGAVTFLSDLMRYMTIPLEIDFMSISSYGDSSVSSGIVQIRKDIDIEIKDRHIIIVEDIIDSGLSLQYIIDYLHKHQPQTIKTCVLLDKPDAHKIDIEIDFVGFQIQNEFVVGFGLDFARKYRNLPFIGVLKEEVYK